MKTRSPILFKYRDKSANGSHIPVDPRDRLRDLEAPLVLVVVPIILLLWMNYGRQASFERLFHAEFGGIRQLDFWSTVYEYTATFLLLFCVPVLIESVVFGRHPRDFGVQLGNRRAGFRIVLVAAPVLLCATWFGSSNVSLQAEYPLAKSTMQMPILFLVVELFYLAFYVGWEFFFRGFMLFGLEKYGAGLAILMQTIPSAVLHIGKPAEEVLASILAGPILGYMALRTRSILYPVILHAVVGIGLDLFVTLRLI